jgi:hypothetical protein
MNPKEKKKAEQVGKLEVIYGDPLIFWNYENINNKKYIGFYVKSVVSKKRCDLIDEWWKNKIIFEKTKWKSCPVPNSDEWKKFY